MEEFLQSWGYLGVFLGILATGVGFPMPEELPIVVGGALAGSNHNYWWLMLPVCIIGVVIGDGMLYGIGRYWGPRLVQYSFVKKRILPPDRLQKIEDNFHQYGIKILLFARLTPGIRAPIFLTAGIVRLSFVRFLIADGIYAIPGVSLLFFLGYWFTDSMITLVKDDLEKVKHVIIILVVVGVAGYFTFRFFKKPVITGELEDVKDLPLIGKQMAASLDTAIVEPSELMKHLHKDDPATEADGKPPGEEKSKPAEASAPHEHQPAAPAVDQPRTGSTLE